jgi:hypothetical protein
MSCFVAPPGRPSSSALLDVSCLCRPQATCIMRVEGDVCESTILLFLEVGLDNLRIRRHGLGRTRRSRSSGTVVVFCCVHNPFVTTKEADAKLLFYRHCTICRQPEVLTASIFALHSFVFSRFRAFHFLQKGKESGFCCLLLSRQVRPRLPRTVRLAFVSAARPTDSKLLHTFATDEIGRVPSRFTFERAPRNANCVRQTGQRPLLYCRMS